MAKERGEQMSGLLEYDVRHSHPAELLLILLASITVQNGFLFSLFIFIEEKVVNLESNFADVFTIFDSKEKPLARSSFLVPTCHRSKFSRCETQLGKPKALSPLMSHENDDVSSPNISTSYTTGT